MKRVLDEEFDYLDDHHYGFFRYLRHWYHT